MNKRPDPKKPPRAGGPSGAGTQSKGPGRHTPVSACDASGIKQEQPHSNPNLAVSYTAFQSPEPLSKRFALADGCKLVKTPAANMTKGRAVRVSLDFAAFGAALARASEREAWGYGLHDAATHGEAVKLAIAAKANPAKGVLARTREYFDYRAEPGVLMVDHDPNPDGPAVRPEQLRGILAAVWPEFSGAAVWARGSLSAGVHREGEAPKPGRGFHLYFAVADAADIPRFGKALFKRLWLAGHGFIAVSGAGSFLVRSVIDGAVFDGERLDFVGKPVVGPGLAYTAPEAAYHAGGYLDTRSLPDLDPAEERQLAALIDQAKQGREADRRARRGKWEATHVRAMVGRGVPEPEALAQTRHIPADGKPGDLYRDWPLEFATLGFATVGDVLGNPARYDGAALADPFEGVEYGRTTAKFFANGKDGKPVIHSHAHGGGKYFLKASAGPVARPPEPPFDPAYCEQQLAGMREEGIPAALSSFPPTVEPRPNKPGKAGNQPGGGNPGKPGKAATLADDSSPHKPTKADGGKVVAMEDNALRLAFERKISEAEDFGKLVYELAPDINKSALRKASKANLLKQIAKKANVSLDVLKQDLQENGDDPQEGRGRADPAWMPYEAKGNQLWLIDDQGRRPLCNFLANITEEVIHDNGAEVEALFLIEGCMNDGTHLPPIEVSASKFPGMTWVSSEWGARPLVHAGSSIKDHLRAAIQSVIPCDRRRTVYGHTGWRKLGDEWLFLHGGGGLGAGGGRADIEVRAGEGNMRRYQFDTEGGGDLCADIRSSLRLLDISASNAALGVVLLAGVYRAPLGEAAPIDHGVFLAGQTGSRKSEAAAMALAHFGRGFNARNFPANWDDTESDIEAKGHGAKDCVFVVDDFKPRGAANDVHKLHVKADRLFRSVGNQSGRGRRTSDMKQRAAYHPRGLVLATGEDIPRGASLRARLALVELSVADIDNAILSFLQESARSGALERAMGGFLAWLAPNMGEWRTRLPERLRGFRDEAIQEGFAKAHPRAADVYASLLVGLSVFFLYAEEAGGIDAGPAAEKFKACQDTLKDLITAQGDLQADQDEVLQFLGFLKSSLNAGLCHFSDSLKQGAPAEHPSFWGWRMIPGHGDQPPTIDKPLGELVGWVDPVRVYLDGNATFAAVQEMAKATGENLAITQRSLWTRMYERGLLLDVKDEAGKKRLNPKRTIAGVYRRVYVMSRKTLEDG